MADYLEKSTVVYEDRDGSGPPLDHSYNIWVAAGPLEIVSLQNRRN